MNYYFISDVTNLERRENIRKNVKKIGIEPRFFDAIMATRMTEDELEGKAIYDTFLSKGEIGCALSHLEIYRQLLDSDNKYVMVFEDDSLFTDDCTMERLEACCKFVEAQNEATVLTLQPVERYMKCVQENSLLEIYSSCKFWGAYAYIINRKAARNILDFQTPIKFAIDEWVEYYYLGLCKLYFTNPTISIAGTSFDSTIDVVECPRLTSEQRAVQMQKVLNHIYSELSVKRKIFYRMRRFFRILGSRKLSRRNRFPFW